MGIARLHARAGLLLLIGLAGCAPGHCRRAGESATPIDEGKSRTPASVEKPATPTVESPVLAPFDRVIVYKPDGSHQCGTKPGIAPAAMARELKGIRIFTMARETDGQQHIQVCDGVTGRINTFEIQVRDLDEALARGFTKL